MRILFGGQGLGSWQDRVLDEFCGIVFLDPRDLRRKSPKYIKTTLRRWTSICDCLFVFMPKGASPDLFCLFQMGVSVERGILVVVVDETHQLRDGFIDAPDLVLTDNMDEGILHLKRAISKKRLKSRQK